MYLPDKFQQQQSKIAHCKMETISHSTLLSFSKFRGSYQVRERPEVGSQVAANLSQHAEQVMAEVPYEVPLEQATQLPFTRLNPG